MNCCGAATPPTKAAANYFAQFWDLRGVPGAFDAQHRIKPLYNDIAQSGWKLNGQLTPLGGNRPAGHVITSNVVLVVRGDVFRRYPNTYVYAVRAAANPKPRQTDAFETFTRHAAVETQVTRKDPILSAQFEPDIQCFGFDLDPDEARGDAADPLKKPRLVLRARATVRRTHLRPRRPAGKLCQHAAAGGEHDQRSELGPPGQWPPTSMRWARWHCRS